MEGVSSVRDSSSDDLLRGTDKSPWYKKNKNTSKYGIIWETIEVTKPMTFPPPQMRTGGKEKKLNNKIAIQKQSQ